MKKGINYKGVDFNKWGNFTAKCCGIDLGEFQDKEDAARAVDTYRMTHFPHQYRWLNIKDEWYCELEPKPKKGMCNKCNKWSELYYGRKKLKGPHCKPCYKAIADEERKFKRELKELNKKYSWEWRFNLILNSVKSRSKDMGLEYKLSLDDLYYLLKYQDYRCALTGRVLRPSGNHKFLASLDRKNNKDWYFLYNCQLVCADANVAKQDLSDKEFLQMCQDVVDWSKSEKYYNKEIKPPEGSATLITCLNRIANEGIDPIPCSSRKHRRMA